MLSLPNVTGAVVGVQVRVLEVSVPSATNWRDVNWFCEELTLDFEYDDPSLTVLARIILLRGTITLGLVEELPRLVNVEPNDSRRIDPSDFWLSKNTTFLTQMKLPL